MASSRLHAEARDEAARATRADVVLQVERAFFSTLRAQTVLTVAEETVRERQLISDQATTPLPEEQSLMQKSLQARPELASARADLSAAQKFASAEKGLRNPTLSALGSAGVIPAHENALRGRYAAAGINLNIPLFNGHLFSARQTEAELRAQAAEQNLKSLENRVARDVELAFLNANTAFQRLALTAELLSAPVRNMSTRCSSPCSISRPA